jgi:hypothetical protein
MSIVINALFNQNADTVRQTYVQLTATVGKSLFVFLAAKFWLWRLKKTYGSLERLLIVYYNNERAILARYALDLKGDPL